MIKNKQNHKRTKRVVDGLTYRALVLKTLWISIPFSSWPPWSLGDTSLLPQAIRNWRLERRWRYYNTKSFRLCTTTVCCRLVVSHCCCYSVCAGVPVWLLAPINCVMNQEVRRKKMHLPDILWNALTKAISDAFKNSLLVPVLLEFKGTKDVSMFV